MGTVTKGFDARLANRSFLVFDVSDTLVHNPKRHSARKSKTNKLAMYGTDGRLFTTDMTFLRSSNSLDTKTSTNSKYPAGPNLYIVP